MLKNTLNGLKQARRSFFKSSFRGGFKDALMCTTVNGFGKALSVAGCPNVDLLRADHFAPSLAPWELSKYGSSIGVELGAM